jgi:hypothetical protein
VTEEFKPTIIPGKPYEMTLRPVALYRIWQYGKVSLGASWIPQNENGYTPDAGVALEMRRHGYMVDLIEGYVNLSGQMFLRNQITSLDEVTL